MRTAIRLRADEDQKCGVDLCSSAFLDTGTGKTTTPASAHIDWKVWAATGCF